MRRRPLTSCGWQWPDPCDFALVAMLGLLGLRIFEATGADITDLSEEHGHRVLRVCGNGTKVVQIPLPPAVGRAIDRSTGHRTGGWPSWPPTPRWHRRSAAGAAGRCRTVRLPAAPGIH